MAVAENRLQYVTFGPLSHWNFGTGSHSFSKGFEVAYWNYPPGQPLMDGGQPIPGDGEIGFGMDIGFEWERQKVRCYLEPQLGMSIAGISAGPVAEWTYGGQPVQVGMQASAWTNPVFAGVDIRGRWMDGKRFLSPGLSAKIPIRVSQ